ncbi:transmembrane protein, putative (macronuclear) [Tetrahymena thermophila SB210]|uniref:Transmembrane protein, putative n=1 Tax=Tetrahymena thermophila (strain SB210) TaxID=312017 RepID=I7LWK8_TETTS|nr:transmembrane protein, putative [Tetrahymena thermophila SB210]EAS02077.3 transmembrane protein, putative [Tetrahymena thermophila SB210]|eukprot:XP_001022322.3 transmembrane protein, putative [Tetrahymena thermophila SB210]
MYVCIEQKMKRNKKERRNNQGFYCFDIIIIRNTKLDFKNQLNYIKEIHSSSIKLQRLQIQTDNQYQYLDQQTKQSLKKRKGNLKIDKIQIQINQLQNINQIKMNFDNCNYVISNASSLIRSLLNQAQQASTNSETGYQTSTDDLMGREPSTNGGNDGMFGNFFEMIIIIVGFLFIYSLLGNYINNRRNKLNQKHRSNNDDNNRDRDTSSIN